jgi:hypothetical protein
MNSRDTWDVLLLDFDGVPDVVFAYSTKPKIRWHAEGYELLGLAAVLTEMLEPYPELKVVLPTSWAPRHYPRACCLLSLREHYRLITDLTPTETVLVRLGTVR